MDKSGRAASDGARRKESKGDRQRLNDADPGRLTLADLALEADAIGPHCLVFVRAERAVKDAAVRYVGVCVCRWETLPHNSEALTRRKFQLHRDVPWSALGF